MTEPIIVLKNLCVSYGEQRVLQNLNLAVGKGEAVAIVGPSGVGKTTLLKTLLGLLPKKASMTYDTAILRGETWPKSEAAWHELRGKCITYVTQGAMASFSPYFTLEAQCRDLAKAIGLSWEEALERIESLCTALDLTPQILKAYPPELSGGMAQRVALLLALLPKPDILIADEPAASLDMVRQLQLVNLLKKVQQSQGLTLLFVTHQRDLAHCIGDFVYEIKEGLLQRLDEGSLRVEAPAVTVEAPIDSLATVPKLTGSAVTVEELTGSAAAVEEFSGATVAVESLEPPLLQIENVWAAYDETDLPVLAEISMHVKRGEWVALVGLSGAGKSTLFRCLLNWQPLMGGTILYNQKPLAAYSMAELGQIVQPIWQDPQSSFNPRRTVGWSLSESMRHIASKVALKAEATAWPKAEPNEASKVDFKAKTNSTANRQSMNVKFLSQECTILSAEDRAALTAHTSATASMETRVEELLKTVNLPSSYSKRYPHSLSGGECQRAAIARAVGNNPSLLLCDEMTSALDSKTQQDVLVVLKQLKQKNQLAGLVITHDLAVAEALCDRVYVLDKGRIVEEGEVATVLTKPQSELAKQLVKARKELKRPMKE